MLRFNTAYLLAIALTLAVSAHADGDLRMERLVTTTITSSGESKSSRSEQTVYVQGDRQRQEQHLPNAVETQEPRRAEIWDCQSLAFYQVDFSGHRFVEGNADSFASRERIHTFHQQEEKWAKHRYSIQTIDTGERKSMLGLVAHHIVTSVHGIKDQDPSEATIDGWYVDQPEPGCAPVYLRQGEAMEVHINFLTSIHARTVYTGFVPPGFAMEQTITMRSRFKQKGQQRELVIMTHSEVTALSRANLDPALFKVPSGFEKVDRLPWNANLPRPVLRQR